MNSLKTFMNKVGERVREVAPQPPIIDGTDPRNEEMEGFVCPSCFLRLPSPEQLEKHYSDQHLDPSANYLCPVCKARLNSQTELEVHYTSNHGDKDFNNHSFEALKEELMELSTNLREERWYSEELKKEVERLQEAFRKKGDDEDSGTYVHQTQLDAIEESKKLLSSEVVLLRKQLTESLEQMSSLRAEKDALEQRASEFAVEKAELRAAVDSFQSEKVTLTTELLDVKASLTSLTASHKEETGRLKQELSNLESIIESKSKEVQNLKDTESALQHDLKIKSEVSSSAKEEARELKFEIDLMKQKLQEKSDEAVALNANLKEKEQLIIASVNASSTDGLTENGSVEKEENESQQRGIGNDDAIIVEKDMEIDCLKSSLRDAQRSQTYAQDLLKDKMKLIDDLEDEIVSLSRTKDLNISRLSEMEASAKEKDVKIQELLESIKELNVLKEKLSENINEKQILEKTIETERTKVTELSVAKADHIKELTEARKKIEAFNSSLESTQEELLKAVESLSVRDQTVQSLETQASQLTVEKNELSENLKSVKITLEKEIESLCSRLSSLEKEKESNEEEKTNLHNRITCLENEKEITEIHHQEIVVSLTNQVTELEHKGNSLKEDKDALEAKLNSSSNEVLRIEAENSNLKEFVSNLTQDVQVREERENKLNDSIKSLQNETKENASRNSILSKEIESFQNKVSALEEKLQLEQSKTLELEGRLADQEAEMAGLAGDKLELEVKVEAATEEQKGLVERCVSAESEVERMQTQVTQLRRKLDDSTAGLHELGRENQSLQIEAAKLSGRKWAEDSEVQNCSKCDKNFSMTVRRHHCRNCYQIFCNDCSSKQISIEQNKKPVRVCDACHSEIIGKL